MGKGKGGAHAQAPKTLTTKGANKMKTMCAVCDHCTINMAYKNEWDVKEK